MDYSLSARIKTIYLLILSSGLFFTSSTVVLALLSGFQIVLYFASGLSVQGLFSAYKRILILAVIVTISFLFIPSDPTTNHTVLTLFHYPLHLYWGEWPNIAAMLLRIITLITASLWVRDSERSGAFIESLRWLKIPETVAIAVDAGLQLSQRRKGPKKHGKKKKGGKNKVAITFQQIKSGELRFFDDLLNKAYQKVNHFLQERYSNISGAKRHDITIILTVVTAALSLKLLQLLPGLPIAPGHKNLVIVPLIVIATLATHSRYGGFSAGLAIGISSFLLGYGKFGVLEIAHFALPGLVSDILAPLVLAKSRKFLIIRFALLGAVIGLTRFAANFLIIILAGAPLLAWAAFLPMLVSQTAFGALSALIGAYIVQKIKSGQLFEVTDATQKKSQSEEESTKNV